MSKKSSVAVGEEDQSKHHRLKRFAGLAGGFIILMAFWDAISGFVLHMLFYALEFLELGWEYLLEMLFHLEPHEAQMYTAWTGLAVFLALGVYVYMRTAAYLRGRFHTWAEFWAWLHSRASENWSILTVFVAALAAKILLF